MRWGIDVLMLIKKNRCYYKRRKNCRVDFGLQSRRLCSIIRACVSQTCEYLSVDGAQHQTAIFFLMNTPNRDLFPEFGCKWFFNTILLQARISRLHQRLIQFKPSNFQHFTLNQVDFRQDHLFSYKMLWWSKF